MGIRQKLFLGYLAIGMIAVGTELLTLNELKKSQASIDKRMRERVQSLSNASREDDLSKLIRYYDEVLTQSVRNYAFTRDKKWEERYRSFEPKLDAAIKEAITRGDEVDAEFFSDVDKANAALVKMEYASIELVNDSKTDAAIKILESSNYWTQKAIYGERLDSYVEKRKFREGHAFDSLLEMTNSRSEEYQQLSGRYTRMALISAIVICAAAIALPFLVWRTVRPLRQ